MRLNVISIGATFLLILGIAGWFWHASGQYEAEPVYGLRAPTTWIEASRVKPLVVPFTSTDVPMTGVVLYSDDAATMAAKLEVRIEDVQGGVLAAQRRQAVYYPQSGEPAIHIFLSKAAYDAGQSLRLVVEPTSEDAVRFLANEAIEGEDSHQLVFSVLYQRSVSAGARQGIFIGVIVAAAMVLVYSIRFIKVSYQWMVAMGVVGMTAGLVCLPYIYRLDAWGINDWDYRYSLSHIYQLTLREYHQLPLWNPFICGGAAALGDPEFALFTPSFALQFLFGVEMGTGLSLLFGLVVTGVGVVWLSRLLGYEPVAGVLAAVIVVCSSSLLLKMTEGHVTIVWAYMWVPWMMGAWFTAYMEWGKGSGKQYGWALVTGVCLMLMLLQGGIYILSYSMLLFIGLILFSRRHVHALMVSVLAGVWMLGLSSFQLLPSVFWMREFPDKVFVGSTYTWDKLPDIFLGRYMHGTFILHDQLSNWHEYGAYVGWGVVLLLVSSLFIWRSSRVVRALWIGLLVTIVISSLGPLVAPLLSHLPFLPRSNISRLTLFSVLSSALLSGFAASYWLRRWPRYAFLLLAVAGFISIDLISLGYPIAEQAFVIPKVSIPLPFAAPPLLHTSEAHVVRHDGFDIPRAYAATLQGYGTSSFCAVLGPEATITMVSSENLTPPYLTTPGSAEVELVSWSPNRIVFSYTAAGVTDILLNTNYASGWQTSHGVVRSDAKQLTVEVPAGEKQEVRVWYQPPGLMVGIAISSITLLVAIVLYIAQRRRGLNS